MKLQEKFAKLEPTAFGPWLAAFKSLFTKEELDKEISKIQPEEIEYFDNIITILNNASMALYSNNYNKNLFKEEAIIKPIEDADKNIISLVIGLAKLQKTVPCKALAILLNSVKEIEENTDTSNGTYIVKKYKANINQAFTKITNKQIEEFFEFIINLPKDKSAYENYFLQEEKSGYSKIQAFKDVPKINELVVKFGDSNNEIYRNHHEAIGVGTRELLGYLNNLQPDITEKVLFTGNVEPITYGCSGI